MCIRYHAECPWAMTPKKKAAQAVSMVLAFGANSHDRKTITAIYSLPFCEQHGDFTAFLADLHNQKFAQQKLKQSGQKAWRSFWKPTLPAPMYPYLMMGLDLSGSSPACRSRGFMAMWQHDVQCRSGIGPWTANTATNVIHVSPIKVWPLFKFIKSTNWFRKQHWSFNQHPTPVILGLWHILLEAWVVPHLPQTLQEKGSEKLLWTICPMFNIDAAKFANSQDLSM